MADTTTQAPPTRTHCPNCGQKIHRQDMSNCLYCAMPFDFVEKKEGKKPSAVQARLVRMREHADWEAAMAWNPPVEADLERAAQGVRRGGVLAGFGLLLGLWGLAAGIGWVRLVLGLVLVGLGLWLIVPALSLRQARLRLPLLKRAALVSDRRSETNLRWMSGSTNYYFQLELEDGGSGEFRYPARGIQDDLLVKGNTGVAYTRGDELVAFRNIKV
ncbi:MAG: hypothetical protein GC161_08940 [Planctomycetaceae bacterium]|nr:hypothetical protein [Planctomycetaceae bacterium]